MPREEVIVIGAGMGGLAAAIDCAAAGASVTVIELQQKAGGKLRQLGVGGAMIDAGPTVFTMRHVFDDLFAGAGTTLEAEAPIEQASILARHVWGDGARLDLYADAEESADAIRHFSGPGEAGRFLEFIAHIRRVYATLDESFLRSSRPTPAEMMRRAGLAGLPDLFALKPWSSLWRSLGTFFRDPRLRQLYGRYATYCGSSPFEASATLMIVAHVEQMGVYYVRGGMIRLAEALEAVARRLGVRFEYGTGVRQIDCTSGAVSGCDARQRRADPCVGGHLQRGYQRGRCGAVRDRGTAGGKPCRALEALALGGCRHVFGRCRGFSTASAYCVLLG